MGLFDAFKKQKAPFVAWENGKVVAMKDVEDETFSQEILGPGVAIEPSEGVVCAPCDGEITLVADTKHAVSITAKNGAEILIHIGIDTVELNGECFTAHAKTGDSVKAGDKLIEFDMAAIKEKGYKLTTPLIICNKDEFSTIETLASGDVKIGDEILKAE